MERSQREVQALSTMISSEYFDNICRINDKRVLAFFVQLRSDCFKFYSEKMRTVFGNTKSYMEATDLQKLHKQTKMKCYAQVCLISVFRH